MGCSGSKEDHLPLVVRCRERQELIRAAANHRYALAAAHVSYFHSLKEVGEALRKFVDEELVTASSSSLSSPSLTLPRSSKKNHGNECESPLHLHDDDEESHLHISDSSLEDDGDSEDDNLHHHHHSREHGGTQDGDEHQHHHSNRSEERVRHSHNEDESSSRFPHDGFSGYVNGYVNIPFANPYPYPMPNRRYGPYGESYSDRWDPQGMPPPPQPWFYSGNSNVHYMKKSAPATNTVVRDPPPQPAYGYSDSYWNPPAGYGGNYGYFSTGSPTRMEDKGGVKGKPARDAPPPPSPKASVLDYFEQLTVFDVGYPGYLDGGYGYESNYSSPDSTEVREREGIPDLEEETETEAYKEVSSRTVPASKNIESNSKSLPMHKSEGSSKSMPPHGSDNGSRSVKLHRKDGNSMSESSSKRKGSSSSASLHKIDSSSVSLHSEESDGPSMPPHNDSKESVKQSTSTPHGEGISAEREMPSSINLKDDKSSSEEMVLKSVDEGSAKKKGVTFEVEETSKQDGDSSKLSSVALSSPRGTRDLREVVAEIRDEFEIASSYGKEVAVMLEVGKLPYHPSFLKVFMSRLSYLVSPSTSLWDSPSKQSAKLASSTVKLAKSYFENVGNDVNVKAFNLSSTLDRLYAWEKKLYKEVRDEERLRVIYEKQYKRLKALDEKGAEPRKIDAAGASVRRLLTKLDVSIKAIDSISSRIHKLRDEVLQPQLSELVHGLTRMWKAMLRCHQKQFEGVMESRMHRLKTNRADSRSTELERELHAWCKHFNNWIRFQRSYVESLNEWLIRCLHYEPEENPDGPVPYSPGRLGAPPIFIICNDWHQAMEAISESRVANAMNAFAGSLWEKQDERLIKDYEKHLTARREQSGVDDLKVELDTMRERLGEERVKQKDAMKGGLGLVPMFKALEKFTSEAVKAHEHVRLVEERR